MSGFQNLFSGRALAVLALLGLTAGGCGAPDSQTVGGGTTEQRTPPSKSDPSSAPSGELKGERPGRVAVSAAWLDAQPGTTLDSSKALTARITNTSNEERSGKLVLVASGLTSSTAGSRNTRATGTRARADRVVLRECGQVHPSRGTEEAERLGPLRHDRQRR